MTEYNTGNYEHSSNRKVEIKKVPKEKEYEHLIELTCNKMHAVWLEFYQQYAALCQTSINDFHFPNMDEIFTQFENILKRNRVPDRPKRKNTEKAPYSYGDWKRMRDGINETPSTSTNFTSTKPSAESGWDEDDLVDDSPAAPLQNKEQNVEISDWDADEITEMKSSNTSSSYAGDDRQYNDRSRGNFHKRGNFQARGGFRGGRGNFRGERGNRGGQNFYGGSYAKKDNVDNGWNKDSGTTDFEDWDTDAVASTTRTDDSKKAESAQENKQKKSSNNDEDWD